MKSMRALNRELKNTAERIIRNDTRGGEPDPNDLLALRETVDLLIERLKAGN